MHILFELILSSVTLTFRIVAMYVIVDVHYMMYTHLYAVSVFHTSRPNGSSVIAVKPNCTVSVLQFYITQTKSYQRLHSKCVTVTSSHNPKVRGASVAPTSRVRASVVLFRIVGN